jgi:hypothetical protein
VGGGESGPLANAHNSKSKNNKIKLQKEKENTMEDDICTN